MDSAAEATPEPQPQQVVFRGKKRKFYRQRTTAERPEEDKTQQSATDAEKAAPTKDHGSDQTPAADRSEDQPPVVAVASVPPTVGDAKDEDEEDEAGLSVAEILRRRNARKSKLRGGVGFRVEDARGGTAGGEDALTLMIREEEQKALGLSARDMTTRFTAQTGLTGELVNKHMMEFVESELAKRHSPASSSAAAQNPSSLSSSSNVPNNGRPGRDYDDENVGGGGKFLLPSRDAPSRKPEGQITVRGKLMEVDLGEEARSRNVALTDRATRRLQGEAVEDEDEQAGPSRKVRLGRDGKPWRPRNRRTSDDIKRDELVEQILKESKLDINDEATPAAATATTADDDEGAADDRIAEEFRRDFMDAMAARHRRKKKAAPPPGKPGAKKDEEILKGPKLGGSRNARAAMRDLLLEQQSKQAPGRQPGRR